MQAQAICHLHSVSSLLFVVVGLGVDKAGGAASQHRFAQGQRTLSL